MIYNKLYLSQFKNYTASKTNLKAQENAAFSWFKTLKFADYEIKNRMKSTFLQMNFIRFFYFQDFWLSLNFNTINFLIATSLNAEFYIANNSVA
jgi:hypothetical protein